MTQCTQGAGVGYAEIAIELFWREAGTGGQQTLIGPSGVCELIGQPMFRERHFRKYSRDGVKHWITLARLELFAEIGILRMLGSGVV